MTGYEQENIFHTYSSLYVQTKTVTKHFLYTKTFLIGSNTVDSRQCIYQVPICGRPIKSYYRVLNTSSFGVTKTKQRLLDVSGVFDQKL